MEHTNTNGTSREGVCEKKRQGTGNIKSFEEMAAEQSDLNVIIYNRTSNRSQAGKGNVKLKEKTESLCREVEELLDPYRIVGVVQKVERGKVDSKRPCLEQAVSLAEQQDNPVIVTYELTRFIRALDYDRIKNNQAWPTKEEFDKLHRLTHHIPLATVLPPYLTESERHSLATRKTGKAGRPQVISDDKMVQIVDALGQMYLHMNYGYRCRSKDPEQDGFRFKWTYSIAQVAREFEESPSTIRRALERPSPQGPTWRQLCLTAAGIDYDYSSQDLEEDMQEDMQEALS